MIKHISKIHGFMVRIVEFIEEEISPARKDNHPTIGPAKRAVPCACGYSDFNRFGLCRTCGGMKRKG